MINPKKILPFLTEYEISLNLADVGASGDNWEVFELLKPVANLLRFDPDQRDIHDIVGENGHKVTTINRAVTDHQTDTITFHLTNSPYCSSTLKPDFSRLARYPYAQLFEIVQILEVPAITLELAMQLAEFNRIDWIKIDTQGTEFRILKSIPENLFRNVIVCDIEASLYSHYIDADTLPSIQEFMIADDFWIVGMTPHHHTRITLQNLEEIKARYKGHSQKRFNYSIHQEPTTIEFCYACTIERAEKYNYNLDGFLRIYLCHFVLGALEYCVEILNQIEKRFGRTNVTEILRKKTFDAIDDRTDKAWASYYFDALRFRLQRFFS